MNDDEEETKDEDDRRDDDDDDDVDDDLGKERCQKHNILNRLFNYIITK